MSTNIIQQKIPVIQVKLYDTGIFIKDMASQATFGDWLKAKRLELKISGAELERRSGVSRQYISNLERNLKSDTTQEIVKPSVEYVDKLAKGLGITSDEARLAAGYAPQNATTLPEPLKISDFNGYDKSDLEKIKSYMEFLKAQKKNAD